jgi:hypothetical protein
MKPKRNLLLLFLISISVLFFIFIIFLFNQDSKYEKILKLQKKLHSESVVGTLYNFGFETIEYIVNEFDLTRAYYKITTQEPKAINLIMSSSDYADIKSQLEVFKKKGFIKDELNYWRKAKLNEKKKQFSIKYKFHGTSVTPLKKDFFNLRIKFNKRESYLDNEREFNLIRIYSDSDENISTIVINNLANKIGLLSPKGETIIVKINDVELGLFYKQERHGKEWFEKKEITNYTILKNNDDWDKKYVGHISDLDLNEKNIEVSGSSINKDVALGSLKVLFDAVKSEDLTTILRFIDKDYFAKFLALAAIINDNHIITGDNLKYIYDHTNGKFKILFRHEGSITKPLESFLFDPQVSALSLNGEIGDFNEALFKSNLYPHEVLSHKLFKILLNDNSFRKLRDVYLEDITSKKIEIINQANKIYDNAYKNIMFSNVHVRHQRYLKKYFFKLLNHNFDKISEYLHYAKIYITEEKKDKFIKLSIVNDSFIPIRLKSISFKNNNSKKKKFKVEYKNLDKYRLPPINIDKDKISHNEKQVFIFTNLLIDQIEFENQITKTQIDQEHIYRNKITSYNNNTKKTLLDSLQLNEIKFQLDDLNLLIKKSKYKISNNIIVPAGINTKIEKGTEFIMLKNTSILFQGNLLAEGTKKESISIKALNNKEPFGTFAIVGKNSKSIIKLSNFLIEGGSQANLDGMVFLGQLSIHNSDVLIKDSQIMKSFSDDGANIRNSNINISNTVFSQNKFDQLDLDFCNGQIINNKFINIPKDSEDNTEGDGIDLSGSNVFISMNEIGHLGDKGISVGEKSRVIIESNIFTKNNIAIAIKDQSSAYNLNNIYRNNNLKISMYIKKFIFKEPTLYLDKGKKIKNDKYKITNGNVIFIDKIIKSNFYKKFKNEITTSRI